SGHHETAPPMSQLGRKPPSEPGTKRMICTTRYRGIGAGEGNRTLVRSLGSSCSAIELHPHATDHKRSAAACKMPRPRKRAQEPLGRLAGGSTETVPISPGRETSRISRSSDVPISLCFRPPGIKHESPASSRHLLPSSNSSSTQPFKV